MGDTLYSVYNLYVTKVTTNTGHFGGEHELVIVFLFLVELFLGEGSKDQLRGVYED